LEKVAAAAPFCKVAGLLVVFVFSFLAAPDRAVHHGMDISIKDKDMSFEVITAVRVDGN
jgi:hypothetical protein